MLLTNCSTSIAIENDHKPESAIVSEKFAIVTCSLLVAAFAIPLFVVIQAVAANIWGTATVFHLLHSHGLFNVKETIFKW